MGSGGFAERDWDSPVFIVEHGYEFEASTQCFKVLAKGGDADVIGVLQFGDGSLRDVETTRKVDLADRLCMTKLVQPNLFQRLSPQVSKAFLRTGPGQDLTVKLIEVSSCHSDQSFLSEFFQVIVIQRIRCRDCGFVPTSPIA
jgi:hypothetical protein